MDQPTITNPSIGAHVDPQLEDSYWSDAYQSELYYREGHDYEDYAPAYCAGYIGFAQYGGSYDDAEASLCANWLRIKGDSRLTLDEARLATRAAWERMGFSGVKKRRTSVSEGREGHAKGAKGIPNFLNSF